VDCDEGAFHRIATALDLFSRRLLGYATSAHPDAVLAGQAIKMAVAARGGRVAGVIFHTDRGSTYTADDFTGLCAKLKITQSMGRVGSCFDNAAAESFFSTLEWEVMSRHHFSTRAEAREVVTRWVCDFYNKARLHSSSPSSPSSAPTPRARSSSLIRGTRTSRWNSSSMCPRSATGRACRQ
jgi:putative transposase